MKSNSPRGRQPAPSASARQVLSVRTAARVAGLNEAQYRLLLRNVGGCESSKDLPHTAFEDVMAVLEDCGATSHPKGPTYWRDRLEARGTWASSRAVHKVRQLAAESRYDLPALVRRHSHGRTEHIGKTTPREAWELIEMLKASNDRETRRRE